MLSGCIASCNLQRVIDDSCAAKDWGWQPEYNIDTMTDDIMAQLKPRLKLEQAENEAYLLHCVHLHYHHCYHDDCDGSS